MSYPGLLITFEGPEGSGKSSLMKKISPWLLSEFGIVPIMSRQPGGTDAGKEIRKILLEKDLKLAPLTEAFLFQADRAQLTEELVEVSLMQGFVVLLDRYIDSSVAYQGAGRLLRRQLIKDLNDISTKGIVPDVTILLDIEPEIGLLRKIENGKLDKIDGESMDFHRLVRYGYLREASEDKTGRWTVIDASKPFDEVLANIQENLKDRLKQRGFIEKESFAKERNL